ncbi:hypothetical protein [Chamaesiphon sp. OTE_20_metabat_361]|uniref:tetratricopeptide repeat protein n=1 Tax=Chamaesiphon sp. OTE_20_metabat_361 TaxID=2964689 RepID=UPI00286C0117|nr:hypothetical protein [Chamaesiphon sp. OTE_20_metabat_361]
MFDEIVRSLSNDLNQICDDFTEYLCGDTAGVSKPKTAVKERSLGSLSAYNQAILATPTDARLFSGRGFMRHYARDQSGAIVDFTLAISLDPLLAEAYAGRAMSYTQLVGGASLEENRMTEALADFDRAISLQERSANALNADMKWVYAARAVARSYSGDNDGAIADFTRCTQTAPSASDYYNLGVSQATSALYPSALASLSKSLTQRPEIATYYARSVTLAALGDEFGASRDYSEALARETPGSGSLQSNDEHAYYFRALARLARDNREAATADLRTTIEICDRKQNAALRQTATAKLAEVG